jgi:hypothetical protein
VQKNFQVQTLAFQVQKNQLFKYKKISFPSAKILASQVQTPQANRPLTPSP